MLEVNNFMKSGEVFVVSASSGGLSLQPSSVVKIKENKTTMNWSTDIDELMRMSREEGDKFYFNVQTSEYLDSKIVSIADSHVIAFHFNKVTFARYKDKPVAAWIAIPFPLK